MRRVVTHTFIKKAICSEPPGGQSARRVGAGIARSMARRRNAADGHPVARPEGAPQAARLRVTVFGKGITIPCTPCLDPNRLWDSACGFLYEGMSIAAVLCLTLVLGACGYHLAGQGRGTVPEDVGIVNVTGTDPSARSILSAWRRYVSDHAKGFVVGTDHADAELRLGAISESFNPVSFDASGVAIAYRLSRSGSISLWRKNVRIWSSGAISVQGDVYAVGGPTSIEASRTRLRRDLDRQWIREAWLKLSSGF